MRDRRPRRWVARWSKLAGRSRPRATRKRLIANQLGEPELFNFLANSSSKPLLIAGGLAGGPI